MLAIVVDLLTGRYGATAYNRRDQPEWPPHPGRLYAALVAVWADAEEPDEVEHAALRWLEEQGAPHLTCSPEPEIARRRAVTHYVPGNDATVLRASTDSKHEAVVAAGAALAAATATGKRTTREENAVRKATADYRLAVQRASAGPGSETESVAAKAVEVLPDNRNRQGRSYPSVTPSDPRIWFCWPESQPGPVQRAALQRLASRVSRLGHSTTFVSCFLADDAPAPTLVPGSGDIVLRVPGTGLLKALEREHLRRDGRADRDRPLPRLETMYRPPSPLAQEPLAGVLAGDWIVLEHAAGAGAGRLRITRSLELAQAVRSALVAHSESETADFITGHWSDGAPRPHLAVVPLSSVGHPWADGTVRGVALMFPRDADSAWRPDVERAVRDWSLSGFTVPLRGASATTTTFAFSKAGLALEPGGMMDPDAPHALRRGRWCHPSRTWVSVTPLVLDRYVKGLHHRRADVAAAADGTAREIVASSCTHYGLPRPVSVVISPVGMTAGVPPAAGRSDRSSGTAFPRYVAAGSGQRRQSVHAVVTFAEELAGPVVLGAGRYSGYGLFTPDRQANAQGGEGFGA